jgi:hypothetical protein
MAGGGLEQLLDVLPRAPQLGCRFPRRCRAQLTPPELLRRREEKTAESRTSVTARTMGERRGGAASTWEARRRPRSWWSGDPPETPRRRRWWTAMSAPAAGVRRGLGCGGYLARVGGERNGMVDQ